MLQIIDKRKYTYLFSGIILMIGLGLFFVWGLKTGIDFKGGTMMEVSLSQPNREEIKEKLADLELKSLLVQLSGKNSATLRYIASDEEINQKVLRKLREIDPETKQLRVDFIGASISNQLKKNAIWAIIVSIVGIALYIAWAFRKVSYPIPSWQYGAGAILALGHDIILVLAVFVVLGKFWNVEIGVPFVAALLTILGYSVNDTIVVYDRIRENLLRLGSKENFENLVNKSLNETMARSINTSLTVVVVLLAIIFFGGETIKYFSIALLAGIISGTYSSIFVASALLVSSYNFKRKN